MNEKGPHVGGLFHIFILLYLHNYCAAVVMYRVPCLVVPNRNNFLLHIITLLQNMSTHCHEELPRINDIFMGLLLN
jgi:hypothetical protein